MATSTRRERPVRTLVTLAVLVLAMFGGLLAGTHWSKASLTPQLALDLEGGTEIILKPTAQQAGAEVTDQAIAQAIDIIRQRVDASGVAEAEITSQGRSNIVVALPGEPDEATLDLVRESAQMVFRPVLVVSAPEGTPNPTASPTPSPTLSADQQLTGSSGQAGDAASADQAQQPTDTTTPAPDATAQPAPADASDPAWLTDALLAQSTALDCTDPANRRGGSAAEGDPDVAIMACDEEGTAKYALGPVELQGDDISSAASGLKSGPNGVLTNEWITTIQFTGAGTTKFRDVTTRLYPLDPPRNQFAMVLDGLVISAPSVNAIINNGSAEISGSFTRDTAALLARELNFGALPLTFDVQSEEQISATLGSEQLQKGLLAGLIGLLLVGLYSLAQYRALGLVTISSLVVAAALAYLTIALLSWSQGYRLSLPGVAGLIVAIGITADSFIVFFERIRDELRDGRVLSAGVDQGWARARRTILASDAVSFLAALVLYFLAVGGVRGFAFTLGLTTLIDLLVVFTFTHPVMLLLARRRFFATGHTLSGLDPTLLGVGSRYVGRGRVAPAGEPAGRERSRPPVAEPVASVAASATGSGGRMTIAERKAAQRRAAAEADSGDTRTEGKDA